MGLAPIIWRQVLETCRTLADEGRIVVLVEQRVIEALEPADRCIVMQQGRVVRDGRGRRRRLSSPSWPAPTSTAGAQG